MTNNKILVEFDDIIYSLQKYGGASTYWHQVTSRVDFLLKGKTKHSKGYSWQRLNCPRSSAAVFHSSHFRTTKSINVVNITTIHDLMYEKGLVKGVGRYLNLFERRRSIVNADAIICISESTKEDMLEYYGEIVHKKPIKVIYHGSQFDNDENKEVVLSNENKSSFRVFLFVGGRSGYKNFEFFLRAYSLGKFKNKDIKIICTGSNFSDQEMNLIASLKITKFITSVGIVASDELKLINNW